MGYPCQFFCYCWAPILKNDTQNKILNSVKPLCPTDMNIVKGLSEERRDDIILYEYEI